MTVEYEKLINENELKGEQIKLVVSEFNDNTYLHFRKYYLDIEGEWMPSKEGVGMLMSIENVTNILYGIIDICAEAEALHIIEEAKKYILDKEA